MRTSNINGNVAGMQSSLASNSLAGTGSQPEGSVRNGIVAIQECRADLQAFLQRTRTRLSTVANTAVECCEGLVENPDSNRVLRGADSSQPLKPLPILAPAVQRQNRVVSAETDHLPQQECSGASLSVDPNCGQFVPFVSSPADRKRADTLGCGVLHNRIAPKSKHPVHDASRPDWKVANAFDRNSYYGPTDFGYMPDEQDCSMATNSGSNVGNDQLDAFCNGIPPIELGTRQVQSGPARKSTRLHLANQIRQN